MLAMTDNPAIADEKITPSYSADPWMWERLLRNEMTESLTAKGIKDFNVKQYVVNSTFRFAKKQNVMGSLVALWDLLQKRLDWWLADKASILEYSERIVAYAQAAGMNAEQINEVRRLAAPHGISNVCFYYNAIDNKLDGPVTTPRPKSAPQKIAKGRVSDPPLPDITATLTATVVPDWFLDKNVYPFEFAPHESELDALLGRQRHTRPQAREWSALRLTGIIAARSALGHFSADLAIIDPKATAKAVSQWWLGSEIVLHAEKFGMELTVQKLQNLLNHYGEDGFTMPTDKTLTREDWATWLTQQGWLAADVIAILNEASVAAGKGAVTGFGQWPRLDTAETVVKRYYAKREADLAGADDPGDEAPPADEPPAEAQEADTPAVTEPTNIIQHPQASVPRTLTGVSVLDISRRLRAYLPRDAYKKIKEGRPGAGKASINGTYIRHRFDEVFGAGMWKISPHGLAGRVEHEIDPREAQEWKDNKPLKNEDGSPKMKTTFWYVTTLTAHTFSYAVIMPDGEFTWIEGFTTSDVHANINRRNADLGAMTSLINNFFKLMGGKDLVQDVNYEDIIKGINAAQPKKKAS